MKSTADETSDRGGIPAAVVEAIEAVEPPDPKFAELARIRQTRLTMPPGSLGRLLDLGQQLAAIQRTDKPHGHPAVVAVFAADHGIANVGISAYPQAVTGQMVANFLSGGAAVNVLARRAGVEVCVADLGVAHRPGSAGQTGTLHAHPVGNGTANFLEGPAMSRSQAFEAFQVGLTLGERWIDEKGFRVVGLGEMGIGNTTAASALIAALTGAPAEAVVGRGTGLDDLGLFRKREVVSKAVSLHSSQAIDFWDLIARLGGFEIIGLAGLAVSAARHRALVVLDGLISSVAGVIAIRLCPAIEGMLLASHLGTEPGHRVVLDALKLKPLLELGLRLGEGSGATLVLPIIASSGDILREMATFDSAEISGPM